MLDMALSCAVSSKPSPAHSRMTNVRKYPFLLVYWMCCFDRAKTSLFPLQPHRRTFRVVHPQPPPAVGGSQGTRLVLPSNSSLGFPAREEGGCSAPAFCLSPGSISAVATADPGRQIGSMEPQQNVKYRCAQRLQGPPGKLLLEKGVH